MDRLFVYGTLRPGQRAWHLLAPHARADAPAWCAGTMVAFDAGYPGVVLPGTTRIVGELVELVDPAAAFAVLDAYEGEEFTRVRATVDRAEGRCEAWIYVLSDAALVQHGTPVEGGDWARHAGNQTPK